jgi:hypothetical protein
VLCCAGGADSLEDPVTEFSSGVGWVWCVLRGVWCMVTFFAVLDVCMCQRHARFFVEHFRRFQQRSEPRTGEERAPYLLQVKKGRYLDMTEQSSQINIKIFTSTKMSTMLKATTLALSVLATGVAARVSAPAVPLGVAGEFAILSQSGVTDVSPSVVVGDVGTSPIAGSALLLSCDEVIGNVYTVDAAGPLPCRTTSASLLTTAVGDMVFAYNSAKGINNPDFLNVGAGAIGGETFAPGVYKWASDVLIASDITIAGTQSSYDRWVFQVDGDLNLSNNIAVHLTNGALVKNVVWQVAKAAAFGTNSHMEGVVLSKTAINMLAGASVNGRLLAQTAVTLDTNTVVQPQQ